MIKVGITGQTGFVGTHLYNTLGLYPNEFERIPFEDSYFQREDVFRDFVRKCDVIVHLAAMNRHSDPKVIYETNVRLVRRLIEVMEMEKVTPHLLFSSSIQEECENEYGKSKREGRELLEKWAGCKGASFTGLMIPNVYGPFGQPNYNSFIATFCNRLTHGDVPVVLQDAPVRLIYVGSLCQYMIEKIRQTGKETNIETFVLPWDLEKKVTEILKLLEYFKEYYLDQGIIPELKDRNELNLFNTFRGYIDYQSHFPIKLVKHVDPRGVFVETVRLGIGGQVSFSTTVPGVIRGNHYHMRKIERFVILRGKALIQLRKIGTQEILNFEMNGDEPSFIDMPIWYTHSLKNVGDEELLMQFWINEWYDPSDGDTFYEPVGE